MKNIKFKKKIYTIIAMGLTSFTLITTGCSSKENNTEVKKEATTDMENNAKENNQTEDKFDNFESEKEEFDNLIYTENFELANEVWQDYFTDTIDMIFHNKEYKDTKWNELNPEAQQEVLNNITYMANKIEAINPDWKTDLESTKNFAATTYYELLNKLKELIGEERYSDISNLINKGKEKSSEIGSSIANELGEWYQNSRNK